MVINNKKVAARKKVVAPPPPPPPSPAAKGVPTAAIGLGMVVLTNYQAEVKQVLSLLLKVVM
jgi:hypothetical protein